MGSRSCERGSKNTVEMIGGILVHGHGVCMRLCTKMVLLKGMLNGKRERAGERRAAPTGNTSRRERRDEAAGTLSRVLGARTGAGRRLASKRERVALLPEEREGGRAGQGWGMGSSGRVSRLPRWQRLYLRAGVGRRCEAEGGTAARAAREGASRGGGGEVRRRVP